MSRGGDTRMATIAEGRRYLAKAHQWLEAAEDAAGRSNHDATVGAAVHAAIAAADAISCMRLRSRWAGDHGGAPRHVEAAGVEGKACGNQLRLLLPLKNQAEYDPMPVSQSKAEAALKASVRAVAAAEKVALRLPP